MRLLLKKSLNKLGQIGDIIDVKDGYGRNYLLPSGNAVAVTQDNQRLVNLEKEKVLALEAMQLEKADDLVDRLGGISVSISMKASDDGHLYGSVSPMLVVEKLAVLGIVVEEKNIRMDAIKELGEYTVRIHVRDGLEEEVKIVVVAEGGDDPTDTSSDTSEG